MIGVNKVILIGNIGRNPDVVSFPQDNRRDDSTAIVKKASFPLATTEYHKNRDGERIEQTEWHNIVCWRSLAEIAEKILRKGTQIYIEGKLQTRSWEDKEGSKHFITEVVADNFTVLSNRIRNNEDQQEAAAPADPLATILTNETSPLGDLPF